MGSRAQSRREFLRVVASGGAGAAGFATFSGRGQEALLEFFPGRTPRERVLYAAETIRLDSNENPNGPNAAALEAIREMMRETNRYPRPTDIALTTAIAQRHRVPEDRVQIGAGSGEILKIAVEAFTGPGRHLVTASPTFEIPARIATLWKTEVRAPRVTSSLGLDLDAMLAAAPGSGLVFVCNPNNPTGTVHSLATIKDFVARYRARAPEAYILIDEAYFEYVDDPGYGTALDLALADPKVLVARTFSKIFGLAGVRVGYAIAQAETIKRLAPYRVQTGISVFGAAAAIASAPLTDHVVRQQQLNREARDFTRREIAKLGYAVPPSATNFVMFDIKRDVAKFRDSCATRGLAIGRVFEPLTTHARVSIGTMDEMRRAIPILAEGLKA